MKRYVVGCSFCDFTSDDTSGGDAASRRVVAHESIEHPFLSADSPASKQTLSCSEVGCEAAVRDHYWGKTRAFGAGWFFQKDGTNWCPEHIPLWVDEWRSRRANEKTDG